MDGDLDGSNDGDIEDGFHDGAIELGIAVGLPEGTKVGDEVDGMNVDGAYDGFMLGNTEGVQVLGFDVRIIVGDIVVGWAEGNKDG